MDRGDLSTTEPSRIREYGLRSGPAVLCIHGFGDEGSMFAPLADTDLAAACRIIVIDLPGFGDEPPFTRTFGTISRLAQAVSEIVDRENVEILVGHSAASIIASIVARPSSSRISTVVSLEGNLTAADAYFTGLVEEFEHPEDFQEGLLRHLAERAAHDPMVARYVRCVRKAQPHALWTLAMEVAALSTRTPPGQLLLQVDRALYLYNPANCPSESLEWLRRTGLSAVVLEGASHWPTLDAPDLVARAILAAAG